MKPSRIAGYMSAANDGKKKAGVMKKRSEKDLQRAERMRKQLEKEMEKRRKEEEGDFNPPSQTKKRKRNGAERKKPSKKQKKEEVFLSKDEEQMEKSEAEAWWGSGRGENFFETTVLPENEERKKKRSYSYGHGYSVGQLVSAFFPIYSSRGKKLRKELFEGKIVKIFQDQIRVAFEGKYGCSPETVDMDPNELL